MNEKNSYALIVGVGKRPEDAEGMAVSEDDAKNMAKAIESYCRIPETNTWLLTGKEANRAQILNSLKQLVEQTRQQQADTVIIYFSGHGCNISGNLFFVANDSRNDDLQGTAIPGTEWMNLLKDCKANKMLVILDCCHAGAFTHTATHQWQRADIPFDADAFVAGKNRVVLTASHAAQVSYLSRPVSIFTYAMIEALGGAHFYAGDKNVTLFDVALYVRERVVYLSKEIDISNPQKPGLALLEKSATENFVLARYPKGAGEPYAFTENFSRLTFGAKSIKLEPKTEADESYRKALEQHFNVQIVQIDGDNNKNALLTGAGTIDQSTKTNNTTIIHNYGNTSQGADDNDANGYPIPFTDEECRVLAEQRVDLNEGLIHIKHNSAIYLQLPGISQSFKYFLKGERFSSQIISLLQRISYEDILRDPEFELLGMSLFNRLFPGEEVKDAVQKSLLGLSSEKQYGRIRFVFQFDKDSLETAFIPWEYLYFQPSQERKGFFFGERFAITRRLENRMHTFDLQGRVDELNVLFALSPYLLNSPYVSKVPMLIDGIKSEIKGKVKIKTLFPKNLEALKIEMESKHYHVVHLAGIAKLESESKGNPSFHFGFLNTEEDRFTCSQWIKSSDLLQLIGTNKPSFVFLHPCKVAQPDLLENKSEQNFIAMTGLAFQIASLVSGALALQTGFESNYTISFLKNFYNAATSGVELYRAVHESLKNLTQSGLDDDSLPRNRVLGMSALFSDLTGKFEFETNVISRIKKNVGKCPNRILVGSSRQKCDEEFIIGSDGQPVDKFCPNCGNKRMLCMQCGTAIDERFMERKECQNCGKNPFEEKLMAEDSKISQDNNRIIESTRNFMPGSAAFQPAVNPPNIMPQAARGNSPFNTKLDRP
jgi:uncharacterized caspase-like protein